MECGVFHEVTRVSRSYTILIVEDTRFINDFFAKKFRAEGHTCSQAFTLKAAKELIETNTFDLIILDLHLPDGEGEELMMEISNLSKTKIVVFTSDHDRQKRDMLFQYGVIDYFSKDVKPDIVYRDIQHILIKLERNKQFNLLIVDDSVVVRKHLETLLAPHNYRLRFAKNGTEFFGMVSEELPDIIILDLELPDMHGMAILEQVRKDPSTKSTPILVISGNEDINLFGRVLKGGAQDYIKKPFIFEEVLIKVDLWADNVYQNFQKLCSEKLLQEYKDAVDRSTIVSKTNPKGIITYVNEKFCEISGFSKEELIGKPHNIVRHPDMPKEAFQTMWETIKSKKSWHGIVKNRTKSGGYYYVDTIINPILNYQGDITEYIGIRTDITDVQEIKERLETELNLKDMSFKDAMRLNREYEIAIDESNILSRTNKNGIITYVNKEFCKVTGYSPEEVIGRTHNILRHPDNPKGFFRDMWQTILAGEIWKGTIMNRAKNGTPYYVKSVIVPIKNAQGEVMEYMAIRNNVTDIILLHQEIEDTQREVIHKMGEIGESRSRETGNHVKRVAEYSRLLALAYGLSAQEADLLANASPMHDIGKVAIPDAVLNKPGRLTDEEFVTMKSHAGIGYNVLKGSNRELLQAAAIVAYQHHEKWDGSGYPKKLKGDEIHIYGRITAIADVFDALGSERVYKKAWEIDKILDLFYEERGKHFDPVLIDKFFLNLEKFLEIRERYKD